MKLAKDIREGNVFKFNGKLYLVLKAQFHKSTSGRRASSSEMKFKLKDLISKNKTDITITATDKLEYVRLENRQSQFLYRDGDNFTFMDQNSFEQFTMNESDLGNAIHFLINEIVIGVLFYESNPVGVNLPKTLNMKISYTEQGMKGDTTGKVTKPATLESGLEINVPLFCNLGDVVRVDTESKSYLERVKE